LCRPHNEPRDRREARTTADEDAAEIAARVDRDGRELPGSLAAGDVWLVDEGMRSLIDPHDADVRIDV
jgi:hypothetical protein